jgi:hypothetical protein
MANSTNAEITASTSKYIAGLNATLNTLGKDVVLTGLSDGQVLAYNAASDDFIATSLVKPTNYLYVSKGGNNTTGDGSANKPYLTVSAAITAASSGTTIFVLPGSYTENITFKAGVNITSPVKFGVTITGNHVANFIGTVVCDNVTFASTTGDTLTFSGTGAQNLQFIGSSVNSTAGDAIKYTNTNAASKIYFEDGTCNVTTSGTSARCFYAATGAAGSVIANRVSFKLNNANNVCLGIGGAVAFSHTMDQVVGQVVVADTATYIGSLITLTTTSVAALTTTSSGVSVLSSVPITTTASPAVAGSGGLTYAAIEYLSTGIGGAATLNGGAGASPLKMAPIALRASTLLPSAGVTAGAFNGVMEYDGTNVYFVVGTARYKFTLTAV